MALSFAGLLVCAGIMLMARRSSLPIVVALIMSFAFGATAIVSLPALGGSSPTIYVVFVFALIGSVAMRRDLNGDLTTVFSQQSSAWLLVMLALYAVAGSFLLPRLFAGETMAFIPQRSGGGIVEVPLGPTTGNITQTLYLLLGVLTSIALSVLLLDRVTFRAVKQGYLGCAALHVALGSTDFLSKLVGLGDVLAPLRTASYAMLTDAGVAGFWRIAGGYSEASGFGAATVALLAFTFSYWRRTRDRTALVLTLGLLSLLVLSTSSTAYVAGSVLALCALGGIVGAALQDRMRQQDLVVLVAGFAAFAVIIGIIVLNQRVLDQFWDLFDAMVLNKASSASGAERAYWNYRSLQSVYETAGLGIGLGSSRASSWVIAVVSQLGIAGAAMIGYLVHMIVRSGYLPGAGDVDLETRDIAMSVRAACLAGLLTASIAAGSADPGVPFFVAAAVVLSYCRLVQQGRERPARQSTAALAPTG